MVSPCITMLVYCLFFAKVNAIIAPISSVACAESSKQNQGSISYTGVRYYLVASSRSLSALQVDQPVLFLFKRSKLGYGNYDTTTVAGDQKNDGLLPSEKECSNQALMQASMELLAATKLYGGASRVHIPFFDNQTSYFKLIIRQENVKRTNGVWKPGKWSQEVIVESMEWKPSLFLFRYTPRRQGMITLVLREILSRIREDQTFNKPVQPVCVRKTARSVCPTATDLYADYRNGSDLAITIPGGCFISQWGGKYGHGCFPYLPVNASSPCYSAPRRDVIALTGRVLEGVAGQVKKGCDYSDLDGAFMGPGTSFNNSHMFRAGRSGGLHHQMANSCVQHYDVDFQRGINLVKRLHMCLYGDSQSGRIREHMVGWGLNRQTVQYVFGFLGRPEHKKEKPGYIRSWSGRCAGSKHILVYNAGSHCPDISFEHARKRYEAIAKTLSERAASRGACVIVPNTPDAYWPFCPKKFSYAEKEKRNSFRIAAKNRIQHSVFSAHGLHVVDFFGISKNTLEFGHGGGDCVHFKGPIYRTMTRALIAAIGKHCHR